MKLGKFWKTDLSVWRNTGSPQLTWFFETVTKPCEEWFSTKPLNKTTGISKVHFFSKSPILINEFVNVKLLYSDALWYETIFYNCSLPLVPFMQKWYKYGISIGLASGGCYKNAKNDTKYCSQQCTMSSQGMFTNPIV